MYCVSYVDIEMDNLMADIKEPTLIPIAFPSKIDQMKIAIGSN